MEFLLIDIGATLAALVGYLASVFWHDLSRDFAARAHYTMMHGNPSGRILAEYAR